MRRGFAMADAVVGGAALALMACVLLVGGGRQRGVASQGESVNQLRQIGSITGTFAGDNQQRMWGYTWTPAQAGPSQYADLLEYARTGAFQASSAQAADILRRRLDMPQFEIQVGWLPQLVYSHLTLVDYVGATAVTRLFVAPGDRRTWVPPPPTPPQPEPTINVELWRNYSSSYELPPAFWSPDGVTATTGAMAQGAAHNLFTWAPATAVDDRNQVRARTLTDVSHPSNKVLLSERAQRDGWRQDVYFLYQHARVPVLMVDGSAAVRVARDANPGFQPNSPLSPFWTNVNYVPAEYEPPALTPENGGLRGRWRFTRSGLRGRDFDGQEVAWQ